MNKKLKIGVLGAARGTCMINILSKHPEAELAAVCDKYAPALNEVKKNAEKNGIKLSCYNNFEDFLKADMDAVILANYAHQHAPFAIRCLKAGKHVLSEVLPCATIAEGAALIDAVEESRLIYAYAENYCYMQHHFEMWRRIKSGEIGEISYAEGEYIHDCTSIWPRITYGDPMHWRNNMHTNFYCTHSLGPMLMAIDKRPVSVSGFDLPDYCRNGKVPETLGAGLMLVKLENGAVCRALHGGLRRAEQPNDNYIYYGDLGTMETGRFSDAPVVNVYKEGEKYCHGEWERYNPKQFIKPKAEYKNPGHMGSDYYPANFFIEKILGQKDGIEWSIDVYKAVEMGICGILAHRSVLNGNIPMKVPNLRNKSERNLYRNDCETTFPDIENGKLVSRRELPPARERDEQFQKYIAGLWNEHAEFEKYPY